VVNGWSAIEQVGYERRGNVVWQVCNDVPVLAASLQWSPVQQQRITVNDLDIWQVFNDTARTKAGTNLEHEVSWAYACESRNASHSVGVDYKVLTKRATR
jgi:hypothetical protein